MSTLKIIALYERLQIRLHDSVSHDVAVYREPSDGYSSVLAPDYDRLRTNRIRMVNSSHVTLHPLSVSFIQEIIVVAVILVVDDDPLQRNIIRKILVGEGYEAHVAGSGEEALIAAKKRMPDIVLTDFCMEHMNGIELMRRLRMHMNPPEVIFMSALGLTLPEKDAGAFIHLEKPLGKDALVSAIRQALVGRCTS